MFVSLTVFVDIQVRIYEVGANGQTQGKAMYGHQGPVLSVCWNKVCGLMYFPTTVSAQSPGCDTRMGLKFFREAQTMLDECSTLRLDSLNKLLSMMRRSRSSNGSRLRRVAFSRQEVGTRL